MSVVPGGRAAGDTDEGGVVASLRVVQKVLVVRSALSHAVAAFDGGILTGAVLVDLRDALGALGQTLGVEADDAGELISDRIFSTTFGVGK